MRLPSARQRARKLSRLLSGVTTTVRADWYSGSSAMDSVQRSLPSKSGMKLAKSKPNRESGRATSASRRQTTRRSRAAGFTNVPRPASRRSKPGLLEIGQRPAQGSPADPELLGQRPLRRQDRLLAQRPGQGQGLQLLGHLAVERAAGGRCTRACSEPHI